MAITAMEANVVSRAIALAKLVVEQVLPELNRLDVDYNGAVGVAGSLTQPDLDGVASYSGLTTQQVADGMFALTSTVRTAVNAGFVNLEQLAARG